MGHSVIRRVMLFVGGVLAKTLSLRHIQFSQKSRRGALLRASVFLYTLAACIFTPSWARSSLLSHPEPRFWCPNTGDNYGPRTLALTQDRIYLGGSFGYIGPVVPDNASAIWRIDAESGSGTPLEIPVSDGDVYCVLPDDMGGLFCRGSFTQIGGQSRQGLAHILPDMTVDPAWIVSTNGSILQMCVDGPYLFIGGSFTAVNGASRNFLAKIDASTGLVTNWNPTESFGYPKHMAVNNHALYIHTESYIGNTVVTALDRNTGSVLPQTPAIDPTWRLWDIEATQDYLIVGGDGFSIHPLAIYDSASGAMLAWADPRYSVEDIDVVGNTIYCLEPSTEGYAVESFDLSSGVKLAWHLLSQANEHLLGLAATDSAVFVSTEDFARHYCRIYKYSHHDSNTPLWSRYADDRTIDVLDGEPIVMAASYGGQPCTGFASLDMSSGEPVDNGIELPETTTQVEAITSTASEVYVVYISNGIRYLAAYSLSTPTSVQRFAVVLSCGVVSVIALTADRVYLGGATISSYDITTGNAFAWNPNPNGGVLGIAIDGRKLYAVGPFTTICGAARTGAACIDRYNALTAYPWNPLLNARANDIRIVDNQIIVGGDFTVSGAQQRQYLASYDRASGTLLPWTVGGANGPIWYMGVQGGILSYAGFYETQEGRATHRLGAVDVIWGGLLGWSPVCTRKSDWGVYTSASVTDVECSSGVVAVASNCSKVNGSYRSGLAVFSDAVQICPAAGALVTSNEIPMCWEDKNADFYRLWIDDDSNYASPEMQPRFLAAMKGAPDYGRIYGTEFEMPGNYLPAGGVYYWRVTAYSGADSSVSATALFDYRPTANEEPDWSPLYRLYKAMDTDHFYTTNEGQLNIAESSMYSRERVEGFVSTQRFVGDGMVEILRFYDPALRCHYYTLEDSAGNEPSVVDRMIADGLLYEGIAGFTLGEPEPGLVPLYRVSRLDGTDHLYTISEVEIERIPQVWPGVFEDPVVICWVSPTGDTPWISSNAWAGLVGDGVSPGTGNFQHYTKSSFGIPSIGLPLEFAHVYNSASVHLMSQVIPLGPGWSHSYNAYILTVPGQWLVVWPDGNIHRYSQETGLCLDKVLGVYDAMEVLPGGHFEIRKKNQTVYVFQRPAGTDVGYPSLLTSIRDHNGNVISLSYEPDGRRRLLAATGPSGRRIEFVYYPAESGKADLIQQVRDVAGSRTLGFAYEDSNGNLTSFTDCAGQVTRYFYDYGDTLLGQNHQLTKIRLPRGNEIDNTYSQRRVTAQTLGAGAGSLSVEYGPQQATVRTTAGSSQIEAAYGFTPEGLISRVQVSGVAGADSMHRGDPANPALPTWVQDFRGQVTAYAYDARGNATTVHRPLGTEHYEYDLMNNVTRYVDGNGHETLMGYDGNGNLTAVTDALSHVTTLSRRANGLVDCLQNALGHRTIYDYDTYGNRVMVRDDLGNTTAWTYDAVGRVLSQIDAEGHVWTFTHDCNDQPLTTRNPENGTTTYAHDENGNLSQVTDPLGHATHWSYNALDVVSSITNAVGDQTTFTYNADGSLASRTRPTGTVTYTYDAAQRLAGVSSSGATLQRDGNGNITQLLDANGSLSLTYDAHNRLTTQVGYLTGAQFTVSYEYDAAGNLTRMVYPGDKAVTYAYNDANWLTSVTDWNGRTSSYGYRADGTLEGIDYANGTHAHFDYDLADRLVGLTHTDASDAVIASYSYTLNHVGNITAENRTEPLATPALENRSVTSTYDAANRLLAAGDATYEFDGAGNMTARTGADVITCTYDLESRLTSIMGATTANYTYDTFGNRWAATRNGTTTRYVLDLHGDMSQVLMETDGSGNPTAYYVYGHGLISRIGADGLTGYGFYHFNRVGSIVAVSALDGTTLTHKYTYSPFGEVLAATETTASPFQFCGWYGVMAEGGDLNYTRARYYDARMSRFWSEDPVWAENAYAYAENNPLLFIDPDGNAAWLDRLGGKATRVAQGAWGKTKSAFNSVVQSRTFWAVADKSDRALDIGSKWFSGITSLGISPAVDKWVLPWLDKKACETGSNKTWIMRGYGAALGLKVGSSWATGGALTGVLGMSNSMSTTVGVAGNVKKSADIMDFFGGLGECRQGGQNGSW